MHNKKMKSRVQRAGHYVLVNVRHSFSPLHPWDKALQGFSMGTDTRPCGTIRKSSPLVVGGELSNWKVLGSPNLATDQTVVRTVNPVYGTVQLDVLALSGRVVFRETLRHQSGPLNHELALRDIPPGTYLVRVRNNTGAGVERLVVRK